MSRWMALLAFCSAMLASSLAEARQETGFLDRTLVFGGAEYRYAVYVPREWTPGRRWPVILALHGGGGYGTDGLSQTEGALGRAVKLYPERFPAIIVFPHAHPGGPGWQGLNGEAALEEMNRALAEFDGDPSRQYLTGFSAGGNGAWWLAYHNPGRFAAAVIVAGWVTSFTGHSKTFYPAIAPATEPDPYGAVAQAIGHLPVWLVHADADKTISVEESRHMYAALKAAGDEAHLTELPGLDHQDSWTPAYQNPDIAAWLFTQRRR